MTPDMVPHILDARASVSLSPYRTDFISSIRPVKNVTIKGITSGLTVLRVGKLTYKFVNDASMEQTTVIWNCLYVPQRVVCLICPRHIGAETTASMPHMTTLSSLSMITPQTICCNTMFNLPILFTKPGISTFINYLQTLPDKAFLACLPFLPHTNLAKRQGHKLHFKWNVSPWRFLQPQPLDTLWRLPRCRSKPVSKTWPYLCLLSFWKSPSLLP